MDNHIILPALGNEIEEAEINEWLKAEGDMVKEGEQVVLITTPKVTMEIEAPVTGRLKKILVPAGELAVVGARLGVIES
ncbi:lipoyl domain-containing protein [Bradyrhizobium sp. BWA-3-5]|uniref:lipoyl domain-containing protein n=1 Tax=Bradyrhizobium sp. BWA-3-5 TaxID=3080013 RepID=UPI00293EBBD0|nr:lipoyl domain-containing protein [Bradyrhizobium sp. BWA-3-5]WOH63938.1 lipoyl domain-containing protein [Bradyrhizobium sp. BWA-3-5]